MVYAKNDEDRRVAVARRDQISPGTAVTRAAAGRDVALFNVDGRCFAVDNACLRCCAPLAEGALEGATVRCRCGWSYDLSTGHVGGIPGLCIERYDVYVSGDEVQVAVPSAAG
jgi:nitrite reductase/ring-hydroxylating ferredoxin subunit